MIYDAMSGTRHKAKSLRLDRKALKALSCECYETLREHTSQMMRFK
jgi:hypothetical protein